MVIQNTKALKKHNQFTVLNEIIENQPVSRSEICKNLDVSHATISYLVKELIEQGLIVETEYSQSTGGRPPMLLEFKGENKYIVTLQIEMTKISYGVFNLNLELMDRDEVQVEGYSIEKILDILTNKLEGLFAQNSIKKESVIGIGLSIPGIYKEKEDLIIDSTSSFWEGINLKHELVKRFNLPVYIENDANLAAYYEYCYGVAEGYSNLVYMYLGEGIGGGIIIDDKLYTGSHGNGGEIGHLKVKASGSKCQCGGTGCLETIASLNAITEEINKRLSKGEKSLLSDLGRPPYNLNMLISAYQRNDYLVRNVIDEAIKYIINAISSLANIFDPDLIILGGFINDFDKDLPISIGNQLINVCYQNIANDLKVLSGTNREAYQLYAVAGYVFDKWKLKI